MKKLALVALMFTAVCVTPETFVSNDKKTLYTVTDNSSDAIGWLTTFHPKVYSLAGIPYGRGSQGMFYKTKEACAYARQHQMYDRPVSIAAAWESPEVPPSDECKKVHYTYAA